MLLLMKRPIVFGSQFYSNNLPLTRIAKLPKKNNWWDPVGTTGPCGPDSEIFTGRDQLRKPHQF